MHVFSNKSKKFKLFNVKHLKMGFSNNLTQKTDFDLGSDLRVRLGAFPYMLAFVCHL